MLDQGETGEACLAQCFANTRGFGPHSPPPRGPESPSLVPPPEFMENMLSHGKGASFFPHVSQGTLDAHQQLRIAITACANMWGEYWDSLICKVRACGRVTAWGAGNPTPALASALSLSQHLAPLTLRSHEKKPLAGVCVGGVLILEQIAWCQVPFLLSIICKRRVGGRGGGRKQPEHPHLSVEDLITMWAPSIRWHSAQPFFGAVNLR